MKTYSEHPVLTACKSCFEHYGNMVEEITKLNAGDEYWHQCPTCETVEGKLVTLYEDSDGNYITDSDLSKLDL